MALRKLERSCRTPPGWRLATVEEANDKLVWIKENNLLDEWDRVRLLNGWIGGSAYDFRVEEGFRSCLGYVFVIETPFPEIPNAVLYSEVPELSIEGRSAALLLCCEDWNEEVLEWLMPGKTEEGLSLWEGNGTEMASKVASAVARASQGFHAKVILAKTDSSLASLEALMKCFDDTQKSLRELKREIQKCDEGENIPHGYLQKILREIHQAGDIFVDILEYVYNIFGFDTSVTSTWKAINNIVEVENMHAFTMLSLCYRLHEKVVMHSEAEDDCPTLASLLYYAHHFLEIIYGSSPTVAQDVAKEANRDCNSDAFSTFLVRAAKKGNVYMVKWLIENGVDPSKTHYKGKTALHYAFCRRNQCNEEVVALLVSADSKDNIEGSLPLVDIKDNEENTPLDFALRNNVPVTMVAWLLSLSIQPESYFKKLNLSLYLRVSSRMRYQELVQKLLDGGANPFEGDDEGKTSLHYAVEGEGERMAWKIIEKLLFDKKQGSINWEKASVGDRHGRNVLHISAFLGREWLCAQLLEDNRNMIDSIDRDGQTAIYYAVAGTHDNPRVLDLLLRGEGKNQVSVKDFSQTTPLHVAADSGNLKMVEKLLLEIPEQDQRRDYVEAPNVLGQTALHKAASGGHTEIVQVLLANGAHPLKERDCDGKTALHFASQANGEAAVKIAELLLESCKRDKKKSLLLFASAVGTGLPNPLLEKYLDEEKCKIQDTLGPESLLQVAARLGDIDMTREFITRGADIALIHDNNWRAPLPIEEKNNVEDVLDKIKTIVEQGTDKPALQDNLGRSPFAIGLAALFLNPFVKSPVTVGISGEWGMGKSSVMLQTESFLLKTAAQLALSNSLKKKDIIGARECKLSVTGQARRRKIANAIERLEAKRWTGLTIIGNILYSIKRAKNFAAEVTGLHILSRFCTFQINLKAPCEESATFDLPKLNEFLGKKYELKYHQVLKSLAVIDRHDMFEKDESRSGNQTSGETPSEEYSLQGTPPSILTVQYNAWHYRNETEAWAGLAVKITEEFEATMTVAHKLRTSWLYNWRNRRDSICLKVVFPFFLALVLAIFLSIIAWLLLGTSHNKDIKKLKYGGLPASMIVAVWGLGKSVMSFVKPISSQVVDYICLPDHSQKLGYHQKVIDDINFLKEQLNYKRSWKWEMFSFIWCCITWSWNENYVPGTKIPKIPPAFSDNLRIIVFVDDLDRCEENVILQVLSAVNLVLATCQINVILSMENSMIQRAIIRKYGNNRSKATCKSNEHLADNYLRKIIQLPLQLPDPSDEECREFLQSQLGMSNSRKGSTIEKRLTYGRRKANPKFQIGNSGAEESVLGRVEKKEDLAGTGNQQRPPGSSDTTQQELASQEDPDRDTIDKPEGSEVEEAKTEIHETIGTESEEAKTEMHETISTESEAEEAKIEIHETISTESEEAKTEIHETISTEQQIIIEKPEGSEDEEAKIEIPETIRTEQQYQFEKPERASSITQIFSYVCALPCLCNVRSHKKIDQATKGDEQRAGDQQQLEDKKGNRSLIEDLSSIISAMLIPKYTQGEINVFHFVNAHCTGKRKLPREWKCLLAYHRLAWNILSLTYDVDPVEGWQVQLIAWIFVCWEWRDLITTLIQNWNNLGVLRKWKVVEENTSGPSLREIVEHYIDERWPSDQKRPTEEDPAIDRHLSSPEEVEKVSGILSEENATARGDDYLRDVLRKVLKEQEEMREALRKNLKEQEEMRNLLEMIKNNFLEEEEESSVLPYTRADEREEWNRLNETLCSYNVSMDGIQAFQKFRFYCQPGYLPWPFTKQA